MKQLFFRLALHLGFGGRGGTHRDEGINNNSILTESGTALLTEYGSFIIKE